MSALVSRKLDTFTPFTPQEIEGTRIRGARAFAPHPASRADTLFSGGSWGIGPFQIHWQFKGDNEIDIDASLFGLQVAELSGTLTETQTKIAGEAGVEFLMVRAAVYADWTGDQGLLVEGELIAFGTDKKFKQKIISW